MRSPILILWTRDEHRMIISSGVHPDAKDSDPPPLWNFTIPGGLPEIPEKELNPLPNPHSP